MWLYKIVLIMFCLSIPTIIILTLLFAAFPLKKTGFVHGPWNLIKYEEIPYIKFKDFLKYYYLNPNSWMLFPDTVFKSSNGKKFYFKFGWLDTFKYKNFIKNKEKQDLKNKLNKNQMEFLKEIQKDIDMIRSQSQNEINQASKIIKKVGDNFNYGSYK